jgi:hypothetical protein
VIRRPVVEVAEGELEELTAGGRPRAAGKRQSVAETLAAMGKATIIAQLYAMRDEYGRSDGWVAHTYRAIFGVWPRGLDDEPPFEPCWMLRSFVRSRDIAFAKSRRSIEGGAHAAV